MKGTLLAGLLVFTTATLVSAQDFDKKKHPWGGWKVGTEVKMSITTKMGEQNQEGEMAMTLKAKDDKGFTRTIKTSVGGQSQDRESWEGWPEKVKDDAVTVGGKEIKCIQWKSERKEGKEAEETLIWVTADYKQLVKLVVGKQMKATASSLSEDVTIGEKKYSCVKLQGTMSAQGMSIAITIWMSPDVPGGMVKMFMDMSDMGASNTIELVSFKGERE